MTPLLYLRRGFAARVLQGVGQVDLDEPELEVGDHSVVSGTVILRCDRVTAVILHIFLHENKTQHMNNNECKW